MVKLVVRANSCNQSLGRTVGEGHLRIQNDSKKEACLGEQRPTAGENQFEVFAEPSFDSIEEQCVYQTTSQAASGPFLFVIVGKIVNGRKVNGPLSHQRFD